MAKRRKKKSKLSLRQRIHYWLCDMLNITSNDDFFTFVEQIDLYLKSQNSFNQLVGQRLKLNPISISVEKSMEKEKEKIKDNAEKGMFG